jgi:hypothetical protein
MHAASNAGTAPPHAAHARGSRQVDGPEAREKGQGEGKLECGRDLKMRHLLEKTGV